MGEEAIALMGALLAVQRQGCLTSGAKSLGEQPERRTRSGGSTIHTEHSVTPSCLPVQRRIMLNLEQQQSDVDCAAVPEGAGLC